MYKERAEKSNHRRGSFYRDAGGDYGGHSQALLYADPGGCKFGHEGLYFGDAGTGEWVSFSLPCIFQICRAAASFCVVGDVGGAGPYGDERAGYSGDKACF